MLGGVDAARDVPRGGDQSGEVQIWDANKCKKIRGMGGHRTRVGRWRGAAPRSAADRGIETFCRGTCARRSTTPANSWGTNRKFAWLKWSYDDRELASGGNDNQLYVWSANSVHPVLRYSDHTAAVKAIAWSPHQHGLLASGGGTADRCIRFWNTTTDTALSCVDTGSQVCNLVWSKNVNEIVSTHGYSQNQIIVWRYPNMSKLATLTGHTLRVLYLANLAPTVRRW